MIGKCRKLLFNEMNRTLIELIGYDLVHNSDDGSHVPE